ncbi:peptide chain release factor N(5)-glutamine methyltransferase [Rhizobium sp. PAMB 3174]
MTKVETLSALLSEVRQELLDGGIEAAATDARTLVSGLLDLSATDMLTRGDRAVSAEERETVMAAVSRRIAREPVHRILGFREFYGLTLSLSPATLEPRPDTEILVDAVLPYLQRTMADNGEARILDLGTGTGAICLALLNECKCATGVGCDISSDAVETAIRNAARNGLEDRFTGTVSDWFGAVEGTFDIIVSNPPYIRSDVVATLDPEVREHDPMAALDGGEDGLEAYRMLASGAGAFLREGGTVAVEIGFDQRDSVSQLFAASGFRRLQAVADYGGNDRALVFERG